MENYQNQYGATRRTTGEYTDPAAPQQVDAYGNPIHHGKEGHGISGKLHRSGSSSSSSSSEDDGQGGRRKKGLKQKIKEKIPGVHSGDDRPQATSTTTPGGYRSADDPHHKKGIVEKIKDKLPGTGTHH